MKTILITGSTDGIGKLVAQELAIKGHHLLLHGRSTAKVEQLVNELKTISNNEHINGFVADFSELSEVEKMVVQILDKYDSLDVIMNNAGVFFTDTPLNSKNHDVRFVVNYLAPFVLTNGLISLLNKSNSPRVVNLSSAAQAPVNKEVLLGKEKATAQQAYAQSKLALTMWSFYFAKQHTSISTIAVNPGSLLNTKMAQEAYGQHWSSANKGSDILLELALSDDYKDSSGLYFDNDLGDFNKAHSEAYIDSKIEELISVTQKIITNDK